MIRNTRIEAPRNRLVLCSSKFDQRGGEGGDQECILLFSWDSRNDKNQRGVFERVFGKILFVEYGGKKKSNTNF